MEKDKEIKMTSRVEGEPTPTTQEDIDKKELQDTIEEVDNNKVKTDIITKEVSLPSNGYFGGPTSVTIRGMTTKEERIMYVSKDFNFVSQIVRACIIEPQNISLSKLHPKDIIYLMFAIREMTFGPNYKQEVSCDYCGFKQSIDVDITEMECNILDLDNIEERLTVTLPERGDEIQLKLMSEGELQAIDKMVERKVKKGVIQNPTDYQFIVNLAANVVSINGDDFKNEKEKHNYLLNLSGRDYNSIQNCIMKVENTFGFDTEIYRTCVNPNCQEEMEVTGAARPEFFRPSE